MIETFAKRMKTARLQRDIKQKDLAERIGVRSATVSAYENENESKRAIPSLENAFAIAKELNVSLDYLCGLDAETPHSDFEIIYAFVSLLIRWYVERDCSKHPFCITNLALAALEGDCKKLDHAILNLDQEQDMKLKARICEMLAQMATNRLTCWMEVKEDV